MTIVTTSPSTLRLTAHQFFDSHSAGASPYPNSNGLPRAMTGSQSANGSPHYPLNSLPRAMVNSHSVSGSPSGSAYGLPPGYYYGAASAPIMPLTSALNTFGLPQELQDTVLVHSFYQQSMDSSDPTAIQLNTSTDTVGGHLGYQAVATSLATSQGRPPGSTVMSGSLTQSGLTMGQGMYSWDFC